MVKKRTASLEEWEIALIKAMLDRGYIKQDIQAYFTRPTRSINQARISGIVGASKYQHIGSATKNELDSFLRAWPNIDPKTGMHLRGDELLIKAREAMISAVRTFNSAGIQFRSEIFIITAIIAWTYLLHAYYKERNIDYKYKQSKLTVLTPGGAERYWDLRKCLNCGKCPLDKNIINNLGLLLEIRDEIIHRSTGNIDNNLSAELQACCINFNDSIKILFGTHLGLGRDLSIALQFVTFDADQNNVLAGADLPSHIATAMENYHSKLSDEEQADPRFRYRVAFVPVVTGKASRADSVVQFVKPGSPESDAIQRILLKESERPKYRATDIVNKMREEGHRDFNMHWHTNLWQGLDARGPDKGFGVVIAKTWYWYNTWLEKVRAELAKGWKPKRKGA